MDLPTFKLALVGDAGAGKTSWMTRNLTGEFSGEYDPSPEALMEKIAFNMNQGCFMFDVLDVPGDASLGIDYAQLVTDYDAAMIVFDLSDNSTSNSVRKWHDLILSVNKSEIPIAVLGSKLDLISDDCKGNSNSVSGWVSEIATSTVQYFEDSSKELGEADGPFIWLLQQILHAPDLKPRFAGCCWPELPEEDKEALDRYRKEMETACQFQLPSEDEADL